MKCLQHSVLPMHFYVIMIVKHHSGKWHWFCLEKNILIWHVSMKVSLVDKSHRICVYALSTFYSYHSLYLEFHIYSIYVTLSCTVLPTTTASIISQWYSSYHWRFVHWIRIGFFLLIMSSSRWLFGSCISYWICSRSSSSCFIRRTKETLRWS